jgi:serine phosphatase RsbU (regulator of sigma subunit)
MRYRRSLILLCAIYTAIFLTGLSLFTNISPWIVLAIFELTAVISFFGSGKPKDAVVGVASKSLQEAFEMGSKEKEIELNNLFHEVLFPPSQIDLPAIWSSSKHRSGTELGGDYYHIFETERGPLVIVGDISGRGFEASRDIAQLHQQLTKIVSGEPELTKILESLNTWLYEKYAGKRRFTCVLARWENEHLYYANADHLPVVRLSIKQERSRLPITCGPLGEKPEANVVVEEIPFQPREMVMIYTDGLYKKITSDRQQGIAQIESLVDQFNHGEINTICHRVFDCAQPGLQEPPDDATLVVIRRQPKAAEESKVQAGGKA